MKRNRSVFCTTAPLMLKNVVVAGLGGAPIEVLMLVVVVVVLFV